MEEETKLNIAMFPWLAFGHMLPFLELSKCLAQKGHKISFISTPRNLQRLPKIPENLSSSITLTPLPPPSTPNLPPNAESTADISPHQLQFLLQTLDSLQDPLTSLLKQSRPDYIIYDFTTDWLPPVASSLGIPQIFFHIDSASMIAYYGPSDEMMKGFYGGSRLTLQDFIVPPTWIPFPSNLALRTHEVSSGSGSVNVKVSRNSLVYRMGVAIQGCDFVAVRSCIEFEEEWLSLCEDKLCRKPVVPVGLLLPSEDHTEEDEKWVSMREWLDTHEENSVVYVALGSEATLSQTQITELAIGLELSGLPFFWVLRNPHGSTESLRLPNGYEERVKNRGRVYTSWVPQLRILGHRSVGGFLTHCGWSSVIEGLEFGLVLIMLPLSRPQALHARVLEEQKVGMEIMRDELDGSFTRDSVAESLKTVMVSLEGGEWRANAKVMRRVFGDRFRQGQHLNKFEWQLKERAASNQSALEQTRSKAA